MVLRRMRSRRKDALPIQAGIFALLLVAFIGYRAIVPMADPVPRPDVSIDATDAAGRELLQDYPADAFTEEELKNGAVILYIIGIFYMFIAIAIVVDDFFVPALEVMIKRWEISPDVAGATLMAAGGSAPELFTSFIGVFIAQSDVGFGTIVGSAVFNILFVIACCAFASGGTLLLTWWPLARDVAFYSVDLLLLAIFMNDQLIKWYEALVLLILYFAYVGFMKKNEEAEDWVRAKLNIPEDENKRTSILDLKKYLLTFRLGTLNMLLGKAGPRGAGPNPNSDDRLKMAGDLVLGAIAAKKKEDEAKKNEDEEEDEPIDLSWPDTARGRIIYVIIAPILYTLYITLPDCQRKEKKKYYPITFTLAIVWIGVYSYLMVWWATVTGTTLGIPDAVMGLTFLAAGTSVPDLLSSMIVARQGYGDMAVSSSVGSNIFDVTVGLPLPWFFYTLAYSTDVAVFSDSLFLSIVLLFGMLISVIFTIAYNGWRLTNVLGYMMLAFYVIFVAISLLNEYGVI